MYSQAPQLPSIQPGPRPGLLLPRRTAILLGFSLGWALLLFFISPAFDSISPWVDVGLFFTGLVALQLVFLLREQVPLVHWMVLVYFIQFFAASLILYFFPPFHAYDIGHARYPLYLAFVVPACIALYAGVTVGTFGLKSAPFSLERAQQNPPRWSHFGLLFWASGIVFFLVSLRIPATSGLSLPVLLLANLRWVGVFILILRGQKGWWICALTDWAMDASTAVNEQFFGSAILWSVSALLIIAYRYRWRWKLALVLIPAFIFMALLQSVKAEYRRMSAASPNTSRGAILHHLLSARLAQPGKLMNSGYASVLFVRFNQGWIVDRVMRRVPALEPYAEGSTIEDGLLAAIVPRAIASDKGQMTGIDLFERFSGIQLHNGIWMGLSVVGEMYANYGGFGGIIAMGIYGLIFGLLFRVLCAKAMTNPVWWAWGPFFGLYGLQAEQNLVTTANYVFKGLLVVAAVIFLANRLPRRTRNP